MPRPKIDIPLEDIKGLITLIREGFTQNEIAEYYSKHGIKVDQATISRRIRALLKNPI
jgi:arginine repressor